MACSMEKAPSSLKTDSDLKAISRKISSTEMVFSTRTILSSMEFGKTMNFLLLTWLSQPWEISENCIDSLLIIFSNDQNNNT